MKKRDLALLFLLGISAAVIAAVFQPVPGYMDSDYYYVTGAQIASGKGAVEPFIWNFFNQPDAIPHPAFLYWMPLASILSALGMGLSGVVSFGWGRVGFILLAGLIPPLTAALAYQFSGRRENGWFAGGLAVASGYYFSYISIPETFTTGIVLGAAFFLSINRYLSNLKTFPLMIPIFLGMIAGLFHLNRADGVLWLVGLIGFGIFLSFTEKKPGWRYFTGCLSGYLLIMAPWLVRNLYLFQSPFPPGSSSALWLTNYDQTFSYFTEKLTFSSWMASGWAEIMRIRLDALGQNVLTFLGVQAEIVLLPLVAVGLWIQRKNQTVVLAGVIWLTILAVMSFAFPFAGARGGFLHSGAGLQSVLWALVPVGLHEFIHLGERKRGWIEKTAFRVFASGIWLILAVMTAGLFYSRAVSPDENGIPVWQTETQSYQAVENLLLRLGAKPDDRVMVKNPPGYYYAAQREAVVIPNENLDIVLAVARRYEIQYLILEEAHVASLDGLYQSPQNFPEVVYLCSSGTTKVFELVQ